MLDLGDLDNSGASKLVVATEMSRLRVFDGSHCRGRQRGGGRHPRLLLTGCCRTQVPASTPSTSFSELPARSARAARVRRLAVSLDALATARAVPYSPP